MLSLATARRTVSCGALQPRGAADGGPNMLVTLSPEAEEAGAPPTQLEGFPGCAVTIEDMFEVAQDFMTGPTAAGRASYWGGAGHAGGRTSTVTKPPRGPRASEPAEPLSTPGARPHGAVTWPSQLSTRRLSGSGGGVEPPLAVASFQDLVLVGHGAVSSPGSDNELPSATSSRSASPAPSDSDNTPVPDMGDRPPAKARATPSSSADAATAQLAAHVARALGVSSVDEDDANTPDAEAAAAAAASVNAAMDNVSGGGGGASAPPRTSSRGPGRVSSRRRPSDRSPPRHLEMASSAPDGVLDASAVSFLAVPRAPDAGAAGGANPSDRRRLAIIMVGLPARGKSFTAHKLARYLTWLGHETRHFNVGKYRRDFVGRKCSAEFFDPSNDSAVASRNAVARLAMEDMLSWMEERGGQVGIFDATNSTRARRAMLTDMCKGRCKVIFLETVCTDMALVRRNVQEKVTASPDYAGTDPEEALADFMRRMDEYEKAYEPLGSAAPEPADAAASPGVAATRSETHSFIRVTDIASGHGSMQVSRIQGFLPGRIVYFLLNAQLAFRPIYLCRHGKSEDNMAEKIGGDSALSPPGREFAQSLRRFMEGLPAAQRPSAVWTSTLRRTIQTVRPLGAAWPQVQWRALDEIDAGSCEGLRYDEIKVNMPDEYAARRLDKLRYRYPRGESYLDVIQRLEPVIIEIERQRSPVLIVAHQAVLRCLYGYFMSRRVDEVPHLRMPLHTVIRLTPSSYGVQEEWIQLLSDAGEPMHAVVDPPPPPAAEQKGGHH